MKKSTTRMLCFADPLPQQQDARPADDLPFPTTKDGKNPWPRIWKERADAGETIPPEWRAAVAALAETPEERAAYIGDIF